MSAKLFNAERLNNALVWVISPLRTSELDIYWSPLNFTQNVYPAGYNVYRLITPQFDVGNENTVKLNTQPVVVPMFRDVNVDISQKEHFYYVVTAIRPDGTEVQLAEPVTLQSNFNSPGRRHTVISLPRIYAEWRRRKYIMLDNNAEYCDLLVKRRSGTRCHCFSCAMEVTSDTNCLDCYGTGFDRGYELLRQVMFRYVPLQEQINVQPQGLIYKANPKGWLVDFPLLRNGDILVRRNGERLELDNVTYMMHQGILTHQDFDLLSIPYTSSVYQYDVVNGIPVSGS